MRRDLQFHPRGKMMISSPTIQPICPRKYPEINFLHCRGKHKSDERGSFDFALRGKSRGKSRSSPLLKSGAMRFLEEIVITIFPQGNGYQTWLKMFNLISKILIVLRSLIMKKYPKNSIYRDLNFWTFMGLSFIHDSNRSIFLYYS